MFNYLIMTPLGKFEIPVSAYKIFLGEWCIDYDDNNLAKNSVLQLALAAIVASLG